MNFDFSEEQKQLRETARRYLDENCSSKAVRATLEGATNMTLASGRASPTSACSASRSLRPMEEPARGSSNSASSPRNWAGRWRRFPIPSCIYLAAELLRLYGDEAEMRRWLPKIAAGEAIGTLAFIEGPGDAPSAIRCAFTGGKLRGVKSPVADGEIADFAIVAARRSADESVCSSSNSPARLWLGLGSTRRSDPQSRRTRLRGRAGRTDRGRRLGAAHGGARPRGGADRIRAGRRRRSRAGNGARLRARPHGVRPPDRLVPGDQTHARRHVCRQHAGALQRLLWRLGARGGRRRTRGSGR